MKVFSVLLVAAALLFVVLLFSGWLVMLSVGILHSNFGWPTHTTGYWQSVAVAWAITVLGAIFNGSNRVESK